MSNYYTYKKNDVETSWRKYNNNEEINEKKYPNFTKNENKYFVDGKEIIFYEDAKDFIQSYYDDPVTGFKGRDRLYANIYEKYIGITKSMVVDFLNNSETNQLHKVVPKQKINRPIVINRPHESYACDITFLKEITLDKMNRQKNI